MQKMIVRGLLIGAALLIPPFIASQVIEGWDWGVGGFAFAWVIFSSVAYLGLLGLSKSGNIRYRAAFALALAAGFMIFWGTAAVKLIGDENPANLMYGAVLAIALFGAIINRFQAKGLARVMFATALAQALVPVIALIIARSDTSPIWDDFAPGVAQVFVLNTFFAAMFLASGLLFRNAAKSRA
jgi:hypothetical protein